MQPKRYRYIEYKRVQEKRQKRLASILKTKKTIYCYSPETAKNSLASIFDVPTDIVDSFIESYSPSQGSKYLELFQRHLKTDMTPIVDGVIYFHSTRVQAREFFTKGLLPLDRADFINHTKKILVKSAEAHRIYGRINGTSNWHKFKPVDDIGPCGTMIYASKYEMDTKYHECSEALMDSMNSLTADEKQVVLKAFKLKTIPKTLIFWVPSSDGMNESLKGLIGYVLLTAGAIETNLLNLDIGYNRGVIRQRDIVGLRVHPYYQDDVKNENPPVPQEEPPEIISFLNNLRSGNKASEQLATSKHP